MVCAISQTANVSLSGRSESEKVLGGTFLVAYGMRNYSPVLGRWINRDPIGEKGGVNLSIFAENIPLSQNDYLGMSPWYLPWRGCCDGKPYNRFTHCCRKNTVHKKSERKGTGVFLCKTAGSPVTGHRWIEIPNEKIPGILVPGGTPNPPGGTDGWPFSVGFYSYGVSIPDNASWDYEKNCSEIKAYPCQMDFDRYRSDIMANGIQDTIACRSGVGCPEYNFLTFNCMHYRSRLINNATRNSLY